MPSESAKKRQAQKKERKQAAAKKKQPQPRPQKAEKEVNGIEGQVESQASATGGVGEGACAALPSVNGLSEKVADLKLSARACTGTYRSLVINH